MAFDAMVAFGLIGNSKTEPIDGKVDEALRRALSQIELEASGAQENAATGP